MSFRATESKFEDADATARDLPLGASLPSDFGNGAVYTSSVFCFAKSTFSHWRRLFGAAFLAGAFVNAWPGIVVQILLIPPVVMALESTKTLKLNN